MEKEQKAVKQSGNKSLAAEGYEDLFGRTFHFNEPVIAEHVPVPKAERIGRLVQVRKKAGAWGSDIYFIRLNDESLMTFENVGLRKYEGKIVAPYEYDTVDTEYTVKGEYPETGFIIEEPCGPPAQHQSFAVTITSS